MKDLKKHLMLLLSGIPLLSGKVDGAAVTEGMSESAEPLNPVQLRPLNLPGDNLFAGHRSHSSHRSHRSSSGGSYSAPVPREPAQTSPSPSQRSIVPAPSSRPTDPGRAAPVAPKPKPATPPPLTLAEKRKLQIMRVQIALTSLGLYKGAVDGTLNEGTKEAIKRFQIVKDIEPNGLMSTDTLNALGVPAVQ